LRLFRGELQGAGAASRALFGKDPSGLDEPESLLLAVLLRAPNAKPESVAKRACQLASSMGLACECSQLQRLALAALPAAPAIVPRVALAPHVARELLSANNPRVQTTLDAGLQAYATELLQQQLAVLADSEVSDGACWWWTTAAARSWLTSAMAQARQARFMWMEYALPGRPDRR
jgi:penicillin-binding protein 1C